ncbi:MAG: GEVED domain-containing protein, partial [Flavobacteriaceae bacterium]
MYKSQAIFFKKVIKSGILFWFMTLFLTAKTNAHTVSYFGFSQSSEIYAEQNNSINIESSENCTAVTELYENFDAYSCCDMGVVPTCWDSIILGGASQIISSTQPASGTSQIYQFGYGTGKISIVVLPEFSNINAGTHQFRFKVKANSGPGELDFGYITDSTDASTFVIIETLTISNNSYDSTDAERILTVPVTVPDTARLAVRNPGTTWAGMYWDDVYWEPIPQTVCDNTEPGLNSGDTGCVSFAYNGETVSYTTVRGADGNIWLQQNLGSDAVAETMNDENSYGHYFQWGRWADGHQIANSATTTTAPIPNNPAGIADGLNSYITSSPSWWSSNDLNDTWAAADAASVTETNGCDPCKALGEGWKLPSQSDWTALVDAESFNNPSDAFASTLKLPANGYRSSSSGEFSFVGQRGYYWSSTTSTTGAKYLYVGTTIANPSAGAMRGQGAAIRCVKLAQTNEVVSVEVTTQDNTSAEITTENGTLQLVATVNPNNVSQEVTWSVVSGENFASVDENGLVTAIANGTATVRATSVEDDTIFGEIEITINIPSATGYCTPEFFYPSSQAGIKLDRISLTGETITWDIDAVDYNENGYADYTGSQSADLISGNAYNLDFHTDWQDPQYINVRAWIDYNQNYQFDSEEEIGYISSGIASSGEGSFNFTVSENTAVGTYRLRVVMQFPNSDPNSLTPCGTINSYGVAIDYNLQVVEGIVTEEYCDVTVEWDVEPITLVNFSDLNNPTSAVINGTPAYEDFTSMIANVEQEETYTITVKGNTNGNFEHDIRVFIDWNQDLEFDMNTEFYTVSLLPSNGEDSVEATIDITVPFDAVLGETRMRIIKDMWNVYEEGEFDACTDAYYGQVEDYTVSVSEASAIVVENVTVTTQNDVPAEITT